MNISIKALLFVIAISLVGVNVQLLLNNEISLIKKVKAEVAGMGYYELRTDYDFKKAVRRVVERYCEVSGTDIDC